MDNFIEAKKSFSNTLHQTKSCRFNAEARLKKVHILSSYSIMALSVLAIMLSLSTHFDINSLLVKFNISSELLGILISIFLIGISSMEVYSDRSIKAQSFNENAQKILKLYRDSLANDIDEKKLQELRDKYSNIQSELKYNHEPIDYHKYKYNNNWLPLKDRLYSRIIFFLSSIFTVGIYYLIIFSSFILSLLLLIKV